MMILIPQIRLKPNPYPRYLVKTSLPLGGEALVTLPHVLPYGLLVAYKKIDLSRPLPFFVTGRIPSAIRKQRTRCLLRSTVWTTTRWFKLFVSSSCRFTTFARLVVVNRLSYPSSCTLWSCRGEIFPSARS